MPHLQCKHGCHARLVSRQPLPQVKVAADLLGTTGGKGGRSGCARATPGGGRGATNANASLSFKPAAAAGGPPPSAASKCWDKTSASAHLPLGVAVPQEHNGGQRAAAHRQLPFRQRAQQRVGRQVPAGQVAAAAVWSGSGWEGVGSWREVAAQRHRGAECTGLTDGGEACCKLPARLLCAPTCQR